MFGENESVCILNLDFEDVELFEEVFRTFILRVDDFEDPSDIEEYLQWWRLLKDKLNAGNVGYKIRDFEEED